jgi:hypothetical protein
MASSGMLCRVALVRTDVTEEHVASFIRVTRIGELGTMHVRRLLVTASVVPSVVTLMKEALNSSETSFLTRTTRRNIPEDAILHSHGPENIKSYKTVIVLSFQTDLNCYRTHTNTRLDTGSVRVYKKQTPWPFPQVNYTD